MSALQPATGILLPESVVRGDLFAVLATFVAINTLAYAALAVAKMLPKVYPSDWTGSRARRTESRSIHPETQADAGGAPRHRAASHQRGWTASRRRVS